jgi:parvulin-like peptidyl-prolyl isomerase
MAEDDKNKVTSLPPPPTDEIDDEWGSSSSPRSERPPAVKTTGKASEKAKSTKSAASRDEDDDEEDDEDDDDDDRDDEEDDDDRDDDEEDDEDDDDQARRARARKAAAQRAAAEASQDWLPDWSPWAALGVLLSIGFLGGVGVIPISFNLKQAGAEVPSATAATPAASAPKRAASAKRPTPSAPGAPGAADQERVSASHLLVSYKGALRAAPTISRTKEEAKKRAQEALAKAKKGEKFEKLVADYSDEPGAAARGGKLGTFPRQAMVKPFADAAFALKPGQLSDVVETDFGYHVILRTQ